MGAAIGGRGPVRTGAARVLSCPACGAALPPPAPAYACAGCGGRYPVDDGIASLLASGPAVAGYDPRAYDVVDAVSPRHFWFRARSDLIAWALRAALPPGRPARVLEVGCGTGAVLSRLVQEGLAAEGADLLLEALARCRARLPVPLWRVDARRLPFVAEFDAIGLFDCLEHVEEEGPVLSGIHRGLRPGGLVVITVPALPGLWSPLDSWAHHRRRYTRATVSSAVRQAGFEIVKAAYFNGVLLPLMWWERRVLFRWRAFDRARAFRVPPPAVNAALYRLLRLERWLIERRCGPRIGASLLVVGRRPAGAA
jgi:SAM-dependent methyltransferase